MHKKGNFKLSSERRWRKPNFYPTPDQLISMTRTALMRHRLEKIRYSAGTAACSLLSVTFEFSGNILSPPPGTYEQEPEKEMNLKNDEGIGCIEIGRHVRIAGYRAYHLCAIRFFDRNNQFCQEVNPG